MADFNNKIETSTSCIGHFVYRGTYETYLGEYIGGVPCNMRDDADEEIGKLALEIITSAFEFMLPNEFMDDFAFTYQDTYHPRFYNFETDAVNFSFEFTDDLKNWFFDYVNDNGAFKQYLKDNYTSRDGFLSFTANNWHDWLEGWNENDYRCVSAMLAFFIWQEANESNINDWEYDFDDEARTIIEEKYTPWVWAEKFDNGYVGVVYAEWDEDEQATAYNAYLLDENEKIINQAKVMDEYDEEFHMSAYAAWEYSWIQSDLTKKYTLCGTHSEPCEVPDIEAIEAA